MGLREGLNLRYNVMVLLSFMAVGRASEPSVFQKSRSRFVFEFLTFVIIDFVPVPVFIGVLHRQRPFSLRAFSVRF